MSSPPKGSALQQQADALQQQADELTAAATALSEQADALRAQKKQAEKQKKQAEKLQRELTKELTLAGGDDRATDPRVVALQDTLLATSGVAALTPPQLSTKGDALVLNAVPTTAPASDETAALVESLRTDTLPALDATGDQQSYIGGYTASYVDLASKIADRLPLVVATVIALSFSAPDAGVPFPSRPAAGSHHEPALRRSVVRSAHRGVPVGLGSVTGGAGRAGRHGADRQLRTAR